MKKEEKKSDFYNISEEVLPRESGSLAPHRRWQLAGKTRFKTPY